MLVNSLGSRSDVSFTIVDATEGKMGRQNDTTDRGGHEMEMETDTRGRWRMTVGNGVGMYELRMISHPKGYVRI